MLAAEPSAAQKSAGNYPKHHVNVRGLRISIENPAGSVRRGTAPDGTKWSNEMKHHYGYIRGTTGKDKDHLDVFLGPEPHAAHPVHIVNQVNEDGEFDEHKVMLGFKSKKDAIDAYHANYEEGWRGADTVATMAFPKFRQWATSGAKRAPARDMGKIEEPEGYQAGGLVKAAKATRFEFPQAKALETARLNAAKPLSEGGLGLPPENTAAERAQALGYALEQAHYSRSDEPFDAFRMHTAGKDTSFLDGVGVHTGTPQAAEDRFRQYWKGDPRDPTGFTMPLLIKDASQLAKKNGAVYSEGELRRFLSDKAGAAGLPDPTRSRDSQLAIRRSLNAKYDTVPYVNRREGSGALSHMTTDPAKIRSRFAAFDPARAQENDLLGRADPIFLTLPAAAAASSTRVLGDPSDDRPRGQQGYAAGGLVPQQLQGLGGYMYNPVANGPLSPAATAALIGAPGSDLGSDNGSAFGADAGVSGNTAGGISPGTIGQALGVAGQLSGTPELGLMGGFIGAANAAQGGNYGPAGGLIGGLMGGPLGAAAGSLAGQYGSGTMSGKSVGNAVLGLSMPGYSLANGLSGGALGAGLFGTNGGWSNTGVHTAAAPGVFGDWGATAGQTAVSNANAVAGRTGVDPMDALMGVTGAFGTAPGAGVFGGGIMGGDYGGAQYGGADAYGGPGMGDYGGSSGMDAMGGYSGDFKRGGRVGYADGGSTGAAFGFFPQMQRRKPANNERTAAANMPLSAVRGWVAGTLGLPGDIESLGRAALGAVAAPDSYVGRNMDASPALPTSEFYNEWLPGRNEGASNRLAEGVGNILGGVGSTFLAKPVVGAARGAMEIASSPAPRAGGRAAQRGVFKTPGGNWTKSPTIRSSST